MRMKHVAKRERRLAATPAKTAAATTDGTTTDTVLMRMETA